MAYDVTRCLEFRRVLFRSYLIDEALPLEQVVALAGVALPARTGLLGKGKTAIDFESVAVEQAATLAGGGARSEGRRVGKEGEWRGGGCGGWRKSTEDARVR